MVSNPKDYRNSHLIKYAKEDYVYGEDQLDVNYQGCEERAEHLFSNGARYRGQWKGQM